MYNLNGKVALVTGAASKPGFGHAISLRLANEGADVVVVDKFLPPEGLSEVDRIEGWQGLASVTDEIEALGRRSLALKADVSDGEHVKDAVALALEKFGRLDILVNNAGIMEKWMHMVDFDEKTWEQVLAVNLRGTFLWSKYVGKSMVERGAGGKIVNIASYAGKMGAPRIGAYVASKFAVVGLTQTLALELAPFGINVNAVCPGAAPTSLDGGKTRSQAHRLGISIEDAAAQSWSWVTLQVPLGRLTMPSDIASLVAFLASDESAYMTGLAISVSGGQLMM